MHLRNRDRPILRRRLNSFHVRGRLIFLENYVALVPIVIRVDSGVSSAQGNPIRQDVRLIIPNEIGLNVLRDMPQLIRPYAAADHGLRGVVAVNRAGPLHRTRNLGSIHRGGIAYTGVERILHGDTVVRTYVLLVVMLQHVGQVLSSVQDQLIVTNRDR